MTVLHSIFDFLTGAGVALLVLASIVVYLALGWATTVGFYAMERKGLIKPYTAVHAQTGVAVKEQYRDHNGWGLALMLGWPIALVVMLSLLARAEDHHLETNWAKKAAVKMEDDLHQKALLASAHKELLAAVEEKHPGYIEALFEEQARTAKSAGPS